MTTYTTRFGSLDSYDPGKVVIVDDDPRNYAFSNVFDVASRAQPFEKIAVAKNLEYVLEVVRVENTSPWRTCAHDEFALVMDGEVTFEFVDLDTPPDNLPDGGSVALTGEPSGPEMGTVIAHQGHMALLPAGSAYRYSAPRPAVLLLQTVEGPDTVYRWSEICQTTIN
ncbi:hypothetical protein [[Mycobacterium] wendilense]|uniref:Hydroxyquinol 1,2-dioxygenase n=1 Tax=[Mycobacterium] wendilense TaxID=3064284 RepID=A0ABN9NYI7_9MYCO|nr:hypothetical protein [Mycolicibacterium sp. MU0050]CAJ1580052.1 hypothetical protein MU0050_000820 [Mycolicibacterium sp. MU0050]